MPFSSSYDLRLLAHNDIKTNGYNIVNSGAGSLLLVAGWDGNGISWGDAVPNLGLALGAGQIQLGNSHLEAGSSVVLRAAGDITQASAGAIVARSVNVEIYSGRNISLGGQVAAYDGYVTIGAGFAGYGYGKSQLSGSGGNITLEAGSNINGYSGVALIAERGTDAGANGNITQYGGLIVAGADGGDGNVGITAGGNIDLRGSTRAWSDLSAIMATSRSRRAFPNLITGLQPVAETSSSGQPATSTDIPVLP